MRDFFVLALTRAFLRRTGCIERRHGASPVGLQTLRSSGICLLVSALALTGCSDEPTGPEPSIGVTVATASLSVASGTSGSVTGTLTRGGGYTGGVTLAVTGLPAGVTATVSPAQLTGTTPSAEITVTAAPTAAQGTYTATVTASGQGVTSATTTFELIVTAAPDYTLSINPTNLSVIQGVAGSLSIGIVRSHFSGPVTLSLVNPPAGVTGAFNTSPSAANTADLVLQVAANVAPGNYPLAVRGTASGIPERTTTAQLTVTTPPAGSTRIDYLFCDASEAPAFLAYQDGTGPWVVVPGAPVGETIRYAFYLTQNRAGVMTVYPVTLTSGDRLGAGRASFLPQLDAMRRRRTGAIARPDVAFAQVNSFQTIVFYGSTNQILEDSNVGDCGPVEPTRLVTGTVQGVPQGAYGIVSMGFTTDIFAGGISTNPMTFEVPPGPTDLVGSRVVTPGAAPDRLILFRDLNVPNGGSLPAAIDFDGPASFEPATATVTITGGGGEELETYVNLVTRNAHLGMWSDLNPSATSTRPWAGLGPGKMANDDLHGLIVFASSTIRPSDFRVTISYVGPVSDQTIALGPTVSLPSAAQVATGAYPRYRFQGALAPEYDKGVILDVFGTQGSQNAMTVLATNAYLGLAGNAFAYSLTMPDVAGLATFPAGARLSAGPNNVFVSGFGFDGSGTFDLIPELGKYFKAAFAGGTLTVP